MGRLPYWYSIHNKIQFLWCNVQNTGHIKNIHLHRCKHKTVNLTKTKTNPNPDPNRYRRRCPDPNARIQKTEELQIKTQNTNLRLRKYERCIFLILPQNGNCKRYRVTGPESTAWLLLLTGTVGGDKSANNRASNATAWPCEMCGVHGRELGELNV